MTAHPSDHRVEPGQILQLGVSGMTCASCSERVRQALEGVPGVAAASVNLIAETASVTLMPTLAPARRAELPQALAQALKRAGYGAVTRHGSDRMGSDRAAPTNRTEATRLWIALVATAPLLAMMVVPALARALTPLVQWVLASVALAAVGGPFFGGAWRALRSRSVSMDVLVSTGAASAYGLSLWLWARGHTHLYFESSAAVVSLVGLGKWLEHRAKRRHRSAVEALIELLPAQARWLKRAADGSERLQSVGVDHLPVGQTIRVLAGERVPLDGRVVAGQSLLDTSALDGEGQPRSVAVGDTVWAGAIPLDGRLDLEVSAVAEQSWLARLATELERAQARRAPWQSELDQLLRWFVPSVLAIAALTGFYWAFEAGAELAITRAIAVLLIACPCAIGLATPMALWIGGIGAARLGLLLQAPDALARGHRLAIVAFDKTGTLTLGRPTLVRTQVRPTAELPAALTGATLQPLALARALAAASPHPLAHAWLATPADAPLLEVSDVQVYPGVGIQGTIASERYQLRRASAEEFSGAPGLTESVLEWLPLDAEPVWLARFGLEDQVREEAREAVGLLRERGLRVVLLSGDQSAVVAQVAQAVGIQEHYALQSPAAKAEWIAAQERQGRWTLMVGDGINDSPALTSARVSIALASGSDLARTSADLVLLRPDLRLIALGLEVMARVRRQIIRNLVWAFGFNTVAIPLAVTGRLTPTWAAAAMAASSLAVVVGSASLRLPRGLGRRDRSAHESS